jgi:hypothetical protein
MTTIHRPARGIPLMGDTQIWDRAMDALATRPMVPAELSSFRAGLAARGGAIALRAFRASWRLAISPGSQHRPLPGGTKPQAGPTAGTPSTPPKTVAPLLVSVW